jgi:hypothetical protein
MLGWHGMGKRDAFVPTEKKNYFCGLRYDSVNTSNYTASNGSHLDLLQLLPQNFPGKPG